MSLCFWCGFGEASRTRDHGLLGWRAICAACDGSNATNADAVALMAGQLMLGARRDAVDLGDMRSVVAYLRRSAFAPMAIELLAERAIEGARRILQERARRSACFGRAADAAAFTLLLVVWTIGYCLLCPPARAAATPIAADSGLSSFVQLAPYAVVILLLCAALPWPGRRPTPEPEVEDTADVESRFRQGDGR